MTSRAKKTVLVLALLLAFFAGSEIKAQNPSTGRQIAGNVWSGAKRLAGRIHNRFIGPPGRPMKLNPNIGKPVNVGPGPFLDDPPIKLENGNSYQICYKTGEQEGHCLNIPQANYWKPRPESYIIVIRDPFMEMEPDKSNRILLINGVNHDILYRDEREGGPYIWWYIDDEARPKTAHENDPEPGAEKPAAKPNSNAIKRRQPNQ